MIDDFDIQYQSDDFASIYEELIETLSDSEEKKNSGCGR